MNVKFTISLYLILIFYNTLCSKLLLVLRIHSSSIYNILSIKIHLDSYMFEMNSNNFELNDI